MTDDPSDPRARFRELPEPIRAEELVETAEAGRPLPVETPLHEAWRLALLGPGTP